ncbi:MAG: hypothetical protein GY863_12825, partial [bacterium]|nr:hypothetical protein [bacterium]
KNEYDAKRTAYGLDAYVQLDLPALPIFPYIKGGVAIKEEAEIEMEEIVRNPITGIPIANPIYPSQYLTEAAKDTKNEYFKSYYYGIGLARSIFELVAVDIQIFVEYILSKSKQENDIKMDAQSVRGGLKIAI